MRGPEPEAGATRVRELDGMVEVYVPFGTFLMDSSDADLEATMTSCLAYMDCEVHKGAPWMQPLPAPLRWGRFY